MDRAADAVPHPAMAPKVLVRGRRWAMVRRNSKECASFAAGRPRRRPCRAPHRGGLHFGGLSLAGRGLDQSGARMLQPGERRLICALVVFQGGLGHDLDIAEAGAVVDFQEAEAGLRVAAHADPALDSDFLPDGFGLTGQGNRNCTVHAKNSLP